MIEVLLTVRQTKYQQLLKVVTSAVNKGYTMADIQVLAPMYKGNAGIKRLNQVLQDILNPKKKDTREIEFGDVVFRKGDKVLQLVNRPNDNIFNGDIGVIVGIFGRKKMPLIKMCLLWILKVMKLHLRNKI